MAVHTLSEAALRHGKESDTQQQKYLALLTDLIKIAAD